MEDLRVFSFSRSVLNHIIVTTNCVNHVFIGDKNVWIQVSHEELHKLTFALTPGYKASVDSFFIKPTWSAPTCEAETMKNILNTALLAIMIAFAGFSGAEIDPELQEKAKQAATSLLQSLTYKFANSNHYTAVRR